MRPQDLFVFFLSGHGKTEDGRFYLIPQDFKYAGRESIVARGIGQDQLQKWFAQVNAQKSVLLFDACESGSLIGERVAFRAMEEKTAIDLLTRSMGATVLTATTSDRLRLRATEATGFSLMRCYPVWRKLITTATD